MLSNTPANVAVGGARPERDAGVAPARPRGAGDRLLPPATPRRQLRRGARGSPRRRARRPRHSRQLRARRGARPAAVQLLLDGSEPISAARVGGYREQSAAALRPGRPAPGRVAGDPGRTSADRRPAALLVQRDAHRPRLLPVGARRHAAHQPLPVGHQPRRSSASARAAPTSRCSRSPTTPIEIVLGKLVPYVGVSYLVLAVRDACGRGVFGIWPRGQLC